MPISFGHSTPGRGGGLRLRTPPDVFTAATRTAAETSRDRTLNAGDIAEFDADPGLLIILRIADADTFQARRTGGWHDVTKIVEGAQGPGPTDAQVTSAVQAGVKAYARLGGPDVPEDEIDPDIARDSEVLTILRTVFTNARQAKLDGIEAGAQVNLAGSALQTAIDNALGSTVWRSAHTVLRTAAQIRDLLDGLLGTGWRTSGAGGGGISLDQAIDGVGAALAMLPEFSYDPGANTFTFSMPGNSVVSASVNTVIPTTADGDTYILTGGTARRFSLPAASGGSAVPDSWDVVIANESTAVLTIGADGSDTIDGLPELSVPAGEAVRVQKVADGIWIIVADTRRGDDAGVADNSLAAAKARADTDEHKAEWRTRLGVSPRSAAEVRMRVNPPVIRASNRSAVAFTLHIEQPVNLFAGADTARFAAAGQVLGTAAYRADSPRQALNFTLSAAIAAAIDDNGDAGEGDFVEVDVYLQTGTSSSATPVYQRRLFIPVYGVLAKFTEKAATAGASRTWTYTLDAADSEVRISITRNSVLYGRHVLREELTSTAIGVSVDHRNPQNNVDSMSVGVNASISGNTLTLNTTGWQNSGTPKVFSK